MIDKFINQPSIKDVVDKINEVVQAVNEGGGGGGGGVTDVQVDYASVVSGGIANINLTGYAKTSNLATVATSGSYNDLSNKPTIPDAQVQSNWTETNTSSKAYIKNKPTIPTVNNATLTIQKNGTTVKTFTANASSNVTCNITVPTDTSDLTNGAGYTTNVGTVKSVNNNSPDSNGNVSLTIPTVNNATLTIQKNGTTVKTFTANASSNVTCNITVPTKTSDITNDSGYTTNVGTVTSVNSTSPDSNGNVTLSIPAAQVNSDWNASSGVAQILNKPTITDTQDTCGATNSTSKLYLVGRTAQSTGTSNSNGSVYTQNGYLYAKSPSASSNTTSVATTAWVVAKGYTTNVGTVTSVNNTSPDANGNVTISIPSPVTESTVSGWGFTKNVGTITGITMNGSSIGTSGVVDLGNVVRPTNLATVATTGDYNDLSNKPGQWVRKIATAFQAASVGESEYLLSNYLPSNIDNWCYSLIINLRAYCNSSSTAYPIHIYTSSFDSIDTTSGAYTAQASVGGYGRQGSNTFILPVNNESSEYNLYHLSPALYMYCTSASIDSIRITIWGYKKEYKLR